MLIIILPNGWKDWQMFGVFQHEIPKQCLGRVVERKLVVPMSFGLKFACFSINGFVHAQRTNHKQPNHAPINIFFLVAIMED